MFLFFNLYSIFEVGFSQKPLLRGQLAFVQIACVTDNGDNLISMNIVNW